jgi:SAM-dependent methyltransferase
MYRTRHFPASFNHPSGGAFVRRALAHYGARAIKRRLAVLVDPSAATWRDTATVQAAYDAERAHTLERTSRLGFDELVYGSADRFDEAAESDFILFDDEVVWAPTRKSRRFLVEGMERRIRALVPPGGTVAEFGSGSGRNLLYLKSRLPDLEFIGLDLSPVSVELARQLSNQFGHPVRFEVANACESLPARVPNRVDIAFSSHALEMMPRAFVGAIDNMLSIATRHVLFFEPIPELWPSTARGCASHCRAYVMDRLRGFMPALAERADAAGWAIDEAERLKTSTNPINETVFVKLSRAGA